MKAVARMTLLFLWLFAVVAPSIIILCDVENTVLVLNLNEEEQEMGQKSQVDEKIIGSVIFDFSLIAQSKEFFAADFYSLRYIDFASEVLLPPPEQIC